jgi:hypothetical protein
MTKISVAVHQFTECEGCEDQNEELKPVNTSPYGSPVRLWRITCRCLILVSSPLWEGIQEALITQKL